MQIRSAASQLQISERSLRHYETMGLVRPRRRGNGYRDYSAEDLKRAAWVRDLVDMGFSLREIRALAARRPNRTECVQALERKLSQVERSVAILEHHRVALRARLAVRGDECPARGRTS